MPKTAKSSTTLSHRSAPYSLATSTTLAPAPTMAVYEATSPSYTGGDHHSSGAWSPESDQRLMRARQQGLNWQPIAQSFPGKSANACRKRHERLMEKRNSADSWDGVKMDTLAKAYMEVREQMWMILADRVNEKWQSVEAKCMEKGFKTLQAAGRAASRRQQCIDPDYENEVTGNPYQPRQDHSKSRQDEGIDHFDDSAIVMGPDADLPPYNSVRSYSLSSSNGYPTVLRHSPCQTIQQPSHPSPYQQNQVLPSFSSTFGQPSIASISSVINRHSPNQHTAVTTH